MNLTIQGVKLDVSPAMAEHAEKRLSAALRQHQKHIREVELILRDENGPRGGVDQRCQVRVLFNNGKTLVQERRDTDVYVNISLIADAVKRRVADQLDRKHRMRRRAAVARQAA